MKYIISILFFCCIFTFSFAQQEDQYTQFFYHKMGFNPGYAGSSDGTCISILARNQWLGFEGAPQTQLVTFNTPLFNQKVGIGASILRQKIGLTEKYTADVVYSYRIRMGRGMLGIGVQGSVRLQRVNFSNANATQPIDTDGSIPPDFQSKYVPNFGAGLYYSSSSFYLGISIPRLLRNNIDLADGDAIISKEVNHFYMMGGILFGISENISLQPQVLLKYVAGTPFDADTNLNFIFKDTFTAGLSYRIGGSSRSGIGESLSLVLGAQVTESILLGISYDYTLSELRDYNSGSIEAMLRYCIGGKSTGEEYVSPRFF